jgi:hypothetical protein
MVQHKSASDSIVGWGDPTEVENEEGVTLGMVVDALHREASEGYRRSDRNDEATRFVLEELDILGKTEADIELDNILGNLVGLVCPSSEEWREFDEEGENAAL